MGRRLPRDITKCMARRNLRRFCKHNGEVSSSHHSHMYDSHRLSFVDVHPKHLQKYESDISPSNEADNFLRVLPEIAKSPP